MKFGPCSKCGGGLYTYEPIELEPIIPIDFGIGSDNYCSKCGASLWTTCFSCNGTGKSIDLSIDITFGDKYCSECGRALRRKKKNTRCSACNGKGKTRTHHFCTKI